MSEPAPSLAAEARRLEDTLREAGAIGMKFFRGVLRSWTKGEAQSPVSEADIAINDLLHERLPTPDDGWLSEESENDPRRLNTARVWVVDPIDGTRAYIAGREDWSISVALVSAGRPVVAGVFAPATDEMFMATADAGATRNGAPIRASAGTTLDGARIAGPQRLAERVAAQHSGLLVVPRIHSLALRMVRVGTGEIDGAIAGGNANDWDLAGADLIVHEAGGAMTSLDGKPLRYNAPNPRHDVLLAAGGGRIAPLRKLVRAHADRRS